MPRLLSRWGCAEPGQRQRLSATHGAACHRLLRRPAAAARAADAARGAAAAPAATSGARHPTAAGAAAATGRAAAAADRGPRPQGGGATRRHPQAEDAETQAEEAAETDALRLGQSETAEVSGVPC